jgi:branched-chain amino acid transport system ATP-binding protein
MIEANARVLLEVRDAHVAYGTGVMALQGVSLHVNAGEAVALVGANGAGKTTLLKTVAGLLAPVSGEIWFDGRRIDDVQAPDRVGLGIALVPEGRRLFTTLTVRENLQLGAYRAAARTRRDESLREMCRIFPPLEAKLGDAAGTLSGGQQQMLAIARALMARPRLLLLDEPSLGLAPAIVLEMFRIIRDIHARGVAVLLVEQNAAAALDVATRAYVLEEGRIVAEGSPGELAGEPRIRRAYLGLN